MGISECLLLLALDELAAAEAWAACKKPRRGRGPVLSRTTPHRSFFGRPLLAPRPLREWRYTRFRKIRPRLWPLAL